MNLKFQVIPVVFVLLIAIQVAFCGAADAQDDGVKEFMDGAILELNADNILLRIENRQEAMSIFEIKPGAKLKDIQPIFDCLEVESDYITHKCKNDGREINVQAVKCGKELCISFISGRFQISQEKIEAEIARITNLIGPPNVIHYDSNRRWKNQTQRSRRLIWGDREWFYLSGDNDSYALRETFIIHLSSPDLEDKHAEILKIYRDNSIYKRSLNFDWSPIESGFFYLFGWGFLVLTSFCSLYYFNKIHAKRNFVNQPLLKYLASGFDWVCIATVCVLISLLMGAGGSGCDIQDMFGCVEESEEYTEPWSVAQILENFIKMLGAGLVGWWLSARGYKLQRTI